jgi:hypothetical protein
MQQKDKILIATLVDLELRKKLGMLAAVRGESVASVLRNTLMAELNAAVARHELEASMAELFGGPPVAPLNQKDLGNEVMGRLAGEDFDAISKAKAENPLAYLPLDEALRQGSFDVLGKVKK